MNLIQIWAISLEETSTEEKSSSRDILQQQGILKSSTNWGPSFLIYEPKGASLLRTAQMISFCRFYRFTDWKLSALLEEPLDVIPVVSSCFLRFVKSYLKNLPVSISRSVFFMFYFVNIVLNIFPWILEAFCALTWILKYFLLLCKLNLVIKSPPLLYWGLNLHFMYSKSLCL